MVVPEKIHNLPKEEIAAVQRGGGGGGGEKKNLFLIIISVLGHPKRIGGLTSNFLCGEVQYGCFLE
jgi:hypothetical protein